MRLFFNMNYIEELKNLGLHETEVRVYLFLLEEGQSTVLKISCATGIARTNCYHVLDNLESKGLIREVNSGKRKAYLASDPEVLVTEHLRKGEQLKRLLPDLRGLYTIQKNKPKIRFYDGLAQVKEIYNESLRAKEICAIGSIKQLFALDEEFFKNYQKEVWDRGIVYRDILTLASNGESLRYVKETIRGLYSIKFLPESENDLPTDILMWDDNIALITLKEPIFGTVLSNELMAQTFKAIFKVLESKL